MNQNEDSNVASHEPGAALVATPTPGAALAPQSLHAAGLGQPVGAPGQDVLKGGMDRSNLFHSLRRRWLLATGMSLLLGSGAAVGLFLLFPETKSATAQYQVSSSPLTLIDGGATGQTKDFEVFKNTQAAYLMSPYILESALRANGGAISRFEMFNGVEAQEQVEWLADQLMVSYPSRGEILEVTMSGPYPKEDLKAVVEAVCKAYYDEVIFRDNSERAKPLQILKGSLSKLTRQVREKMESYQQLAKESGTGEAYAGSFDPETKLLLSEMTELLSRRREANKTLTDTTMQFQIFEAQLNDPDAQLAMVEQQLQGDPMIGAMQQEIMYKQMQIRELRTTVKRGTSGQIRQLERQIAQTQQEIAMMKEQMRAQIAGEQSNNPDPMRKMYTLEYQITRARMQSELAQLQQRMEEVKAELLLKAENNTDLMLKMGEIEQLRSVETAIATRIQNLQVEILAPNRVQAIGAEPDGAAIAQTAENRNRLTRFLIAGVGGLTTLGLTCLGIGYMDFRNRRLNGPEQVDEGLGIRVIGTLPSLSGKKALNPKHPVVAQLTESIDSVRTALMHESTKKKRQIVLVTSPETKEGRTTVASQLAASLAKAGRRTLLIDGDLRSPSLHTLFNSPLEDGLCEVLRAEAEVTDVIRPTQAEGLWLMTAGYCDADAVKALATDQVQPIVDKLRADYDFVIIDGAPVLGLSDSLLFGQHCDGAVLSVLRDRSCVTKIHQSVELLRGVGVRLIGSVVNGVGITADRRVTHLQQVTPKSEQKKIEAAGV